MSPSGPAAAAEAWLARLPAADRLAAQAHTDTRLMVWLGAGALLLAACAVMARADLIGRLRGALETRGPRPWLVGAASGVLVALLLAALKIAYDMLVAVPLDGLPSQGLAQAIGGVAPLLLAAAVLVPVGQWLLRRGSWRAMFAAGGLMVAASLAIGWLPYALERPAATPAPAGPVRDSLILLIAQAHVPASGVGLSADRSFTADVTGGFGVANVTIGAQTLAWPADEARSYVGHVMGHYLHGDIFALFLIYGLSAFAGLLAARRFAAPAARLMGARGVETAADARALPGAAAVALLAFAAATLISSAYLRWANVRADEFSLNTARAPDALAAVIERTWDHDAVDPSAVETALFYTHPPLKGRLVHAMTWKAAHGG